jgi:hypothetical protein
VDVEASDERRFRANGDIRVTDAEQRQRTREDDLDVQERISRRKCGSARRDERREKLGRATRTSPSATSLPLASRRCARAMV